MQVFSCGLWAHELCIPVYPPNLLLQVACLVNVATAAWAWHSRAQVPQAITRGLVRMQPLFPLRYR
jgi:hypothetical protein